MLYISKDWKQMKVGEKFIYEVDEFDGHSIHTCVVTEIYTDHVIAACEEVSDHMWIDDGCDVKPELSSLEKI